MMRFTTARCASGRLACLIFEAAIACALLPASALALDIQFDYRFDRSGYFDAGTDDGASRRAVLEAAAAPYEVFTDTLSAISPDLALGNSWSVSFQHPSFSTFFETATVEDLAVPADTLIVFVGASSSAGSVLGIASSGDITVSGDVTFTGNVLSRGQTGALASTPTDYGPWGGSIWFNSRIDWYASTDPAGLSSGRADMLTTATHEIGHLLGFGESPSWQALLRSDGDSDVFTGLAASAIYGGPVPVDPVGAHWGEGVLSDVAGVAQETLMDPTTRRGDRELLTRLDMAGLQDIGWQVSAVPEPGTWTQMAGGVGITALALARRRRKEMAPDDHAITGARRGGCTS